VERVESRIWLRDEMFPTGPLVTATDVEEAAAYKTLWLKRMVNDLGWTIVAAYGNAQTDIDAYNNVGIPKADTFIVGPLAGMGGTQPIDMMDFAAHTASFVAAQPDNH
jgi:phosphatidate phosphatase PAH1